MNKTWVVVAGLAVALTGCENSVGLSAKSRAANDSGKETWRPTWGDVATAKVRPGGPISDGGVEGVYADASCTSAFLFVDPVAQIYYMSTAAHCVEGKSSGDRNGVGSRVVVPSAGEVGTVVFDGDNVTAAIDFLLIQLDPDVNLVANPQVVELEGPTGFIDCGQVKIGDAFAWHGYGTGFEEAGQMQKRGGTIDDCKNDTFYGFAPAVIGDSGSAVLHTATGAALGVLVATSGSAAEGPMLPFIFRELAKAGFGNVALATIDGGYVKAGLSP